MGKKRPKKKFRADVDTPWMQLRPRVFDWETQLDPCFYGEHRRQPIGESIEFVTVEAASPWVLPPIPETVRVHQTGDAAMKVWQPEKFSEEALSKFQDGGWFPTRHLNAAAACCEAASLYVSERRLGYTAVPATRDKEVKRIRQQLLKIHQSAQSEEAKWMLARMEIDVTKPPSPATDTGATPPDVPNEWLLFRCGLIWWRYAGYRPKRTGNFITFASLVFDWIGEVVPTPTPSPKFPERSIRRVVEWMTDHPNTKFDR